MSSRNTAVGAMMFVALLATAAVVSAYPRAEVADIVRKTKALYDATSSAEVRFEQTGGQGSMAGTLQFSRGNRYRLELSKQTIVSNGTMVWTYTPARKQVIVSKANGRRGGLTPNEILTKFPGTYRPTLVGERNINGRPVWVVKCAAGAVKIGDVTNATLYIDKETYRFQRIELESPSLGTIALRITSARYNISIPESRFQFTPPTGSRVINLAR